MRVVVIMNTPLGHIGGATIHTLSVLSNLGECQIYLVMPFKYQLLSEAISELRNFNKLPSLFIVAYKDVAPSKKNLVGLIPLYLARLIKSIIAILRIYTTLSKKKHDKTLIISSTHFPHDILPAFLLRFLMRSQGKLIVYFHGKPMSNESILHRASSFLCILMLRKGIIDLAFAINKDILKELLSLSSNRVRIALTTNGAPGRHAKCCELNDFIKREYDLVFLGGMSIPKGALDLLKALAIIVRKRPQTKLLIIGEVPSCFIKLINKMKLQDNVEIVGPTYGPLKFRLLSNSKILVFPSYKETWGITILEAILSGCLVIAYDLKVYREIFNGSLLTVPVGQYKELASIILRILTYVDKQKIDELAKLLEMMKERCVKLMERYAWEKVASYELKRIKELFHR